MCGEGLNQGIRIELRANRFYIQKYARVTVSRFYLYQEALFEKAIFEIDHWQFYRQVQLD